VNSAKQPDLALVATSPNIYSDEGGLETLSNILHRLAALPIWAKILLVSAALVVLRPSVLPTPLVMILTFLVLIVRRPEGGVVPKPIERAQRYMPGLDGLRALAVLAVIAYHLQLGWAQGGLLGVGVFFTLSGYLITDLLLGQRDAVGHLRLGDFWLRRARRLLPALFLMLAVVVAWVTLLDRSQLPALRGDVVAAALYVSNWWNIFRHASYFSHFGPPPQLDHLWSLAVEEQFYLM
jgi:hypothetical protein